MDSINRRSFIIGVSALSLTCHSTLSAYQNLVVGGACERCEVIYEGMPKQFTNVAIIAPPDEPGDKLEISGMIYQIDGKTPTKDVIMYLYQTDANGYYSKSPGQTLGRLHGRLRAWLKTNSDGQYKINTIKPAPYPNADIPAHIHILIKESDKNEYYIDDYWFDDDPLIATQQRVKLENRGGPGIIHLTKNKSGIWTGTRNIILGRNIPAYR